MSPQPIRTGLGFSSKTNGAAATSNVRQTQGTHFFTDGLLYLDLVGIGLFSAPLRASECTPGCGRVSIQWRKRRIKEPVRSWLATFPGDRLGVFTGLSKGSGVVFVLKERSECSSYDQKRLPTPF